MKLFFKSVLIAMCISQSAFALNPINGWYAGIILGGSYSPNTDLFFRAPLTPNSTACSSTAGCAPAYGELTYSGFGNIGGQVGIRRNHFRLEFEPLFNYVPYQKITIGNTIRYDSPKSSSALRFEGNTSTALAMVNAFYDFYTPENENCLVPYLGAGVGYAYVKNSMKFYCNNQEIACTDFSASQSSPALQGIIGAAYFMDSFTWFGLDYRYITTKEIDLLNSRVQVHTINLTFNGMFNCG